MIKFNELTSLADKTQFLADTERSVSADFRLIEQLNIIIKRTVYYGASFMCLIAEFFKKDQIFDLPLFKVVFF